MIPAKCPTCKHWLRSEGTPCSRCIHIPRVDHFEAKVDPMPISDIVIHEQDQMIRVNGEEMTVKEVASRYACLSHWVRSMLYPTDHARNFLAPVFTEKAEK